MIYLVKEGVGKTNPEKNRSKLAKLVCGAVCECVFLVVLMWVFGFPLCCCCCCVSNFLTFSTCGCIRETNPWLGSALLSGLLGCVSIEMFERFLGCLFNENLF